MTLNAHAPVPALLTSLERAGWGDLTGREWQGVRTTLHALAAQLPHKSGQGDTTAEQVAVSAGLSSRWVRRCMHVLEDLGIIEWTRGGVVDGAPVPSYIRIVKTVLLDLIRAARPIKAAAEAARRSATRQRIAHLRFVKERGGYKRRSGHAELSASPPTSTREGTGVPLTDKEGTTTVRVLVPLICPHDGDAGLLRNGQPRCPMCRKEQQRTTATAKRPDVAALAAGDVDLFASDALVDLAAHRRLRRPS